MSWNTGTGGGDTWQAEPEGDNAWGGGAAVASNGDVNGWGEGGCDTGGGGDGACRICGQDGHYARECPDKPEGGGLTGGCYNCGEVGHNKADCPTPRVERPFDGTCNSCGEQGHAARNCPTNPETCKLCGKLGHRKIECKERRQVDWTGVPELEAEEAWVALVNATKTSDINAFKLALRAYARAIDDKFSLREIEETLRADDLGVYLIAKKQEIPPTMIIVDLVGNIDREFVVSIQLSPKPRRAKLAQGWPETPEENLERLNNAGFVEDRGVPLCNNCGKLGHVRRHCKQEQAEREKTAPEIQCVHCQEIGHRARDCPKDRINPYACRNCGQEGHNSKECPEPRSAANVECHKCNETGHFSRVCPNVEKRTCRNCGSEDHMARDCDQPRNPDLATCRNCEKQGHMSRECPEPKDWSKVTCSNCGEKGHTHKRCNQTPKEDEGAGKGGGWDNGGGNAGASGGGQATWGSSGDDTAATAGGEASWDTGNAGGNFAW